MPNSKKPPAEKIHVNDAGEKIRTLPNGDQHLVHEHVGAALIMESNALIADEHRALVEVKHQRIAAKKDRQERNGWPPEKSPV